MLTTLLSAVLLVVLMLAIEREAEELVRGEGTAPGPSFYTWAVRWGPGVLALAAAHAVGLGLRPLQRRLAVSGQRCLDRLRRHHLARRSGGAAVSRGAAAPETGSGTDLPRMAQGSYDDQAKRLVVACSGGGIRASAFVLGGINALQARADELDPRAGAPGAVPDSRPASASPGAAFPSRTSWPSAVGATSRPPWRWCGSGRLCRRRPRAAGGRWPGVANRSAGVASIARGRPSWLGCGGTPVTSSSPPRS